MKFSDFGFKKFINETLDEIGFFAPTRIQEKVIPLIKKHQNVIGLSHTGTGKTHAFLLPILNNIKTLESNSVQVLIICPTRELAKQIYDNIKPFVKNQNSIKANLFIGGDDIEKQIVQLQKKQPTIAIGTPTRIKDLYKRNALHFTTADYIVIDECDMIFDLGFFEDLNLIISKTKQDVNISLFSATIPEQIRPFLNKYIKNAYFIDTTEKQKTTPNIKHIILETKNKEIENFLTILLKAINPFLCFIFVNHKEEIEKTVKIIRNATNEPVGELHANLQPRARMSMLKKIKANEFKYVVVTDVAARGVDIEGITHVISIDLPSDLSYYVHRSGRTGRSKMKGESYVLLNVNNQNKIELLTKQGINFVSMKIDNDSLINAKIKKTKKSITFNDLDNESKKIIRKYNNQKIKPGYKQKRKQELEEIKKQKRRENIKKSIDKIKKAKYKKRREELFD